MTKVPIGIAMSGGVDSTVAAALLLAQGFVVHGFHLQLPVPGGAEQLTRVRHLADQLRIPLHLVDLRDFFSATVINYFRATYHAGRTPNPCIYCNQTVKFGRLLSTMLAAGMEKMATGHYARIVAQGGLLQVGRGLDPAKDQSYFLCRLDREQLSRLVFPLGALHKSEVYQRAEQLGFSDFQGREESQDVCFLGGRSVADFFSEHAGERSAGAIVTTSGEQLGQHHGLWHYTIGQRRGLGLPDRTPWYVVALDGQANRVIVGKEPELFSRELELTEVSWQGAARALPWRGRVQLRSRHAPTLAQVTERGAGGWHVLFEQPQRAITPGQYAVLYEDDLIVGSGIIDRAPAQRGQ